MQDADRGIPYTSSMMEARLDRETEVLPAYRILDNDGKVIDSAEDPMVSVWIVVSIIAVVDPEGFPWFPLKPL